MKTETTEDLLLYAKWCERLADVCDKPELAQELRAMSRELSAKAAAQAQKKRVVA